MESVYETLLFREKENGEKRLARVRINILFIGSFVVLFLSIFSSGVDLIVQIRAFFILFLGGIYAVVWFFILKRYSYRCAYSYVSSSMDVLIIILITLNWTIYPGNEILHTQVKYGVSYGMLFILIILTGIRFDHKTVLVITLECVIFDLLYIIFISFVSDIRIVISVEEGLDRKALNLIDMAGRIIVLLFSGGLMAYLIYRVGILLNKSISMTELKERLGQFISSNIVEEIEAGRANLDLSGHKRRIAILFSDIRGFTALSERMQPEELLTMLNRYYDFIAEEIFRRGGTLDKYIGDGIMALFGAPVSLENCTLSAVRAALDMLKRLRDFNHQYGYGIRIGIGLHTDDVVVGNLGTETYKNYTAIGQGVNVAARIESATRDCEEDLLFSESVKKDIGNFLPVKSVGKFDLKGVTGSMQLYTVEINPAFQQNSEK